MLIYEKYFTVLLDYNKSIQSFNQSLKINLLELNENIVDVIKNGQIQKFEIATELAWKTTKLYIELKFGELVTSPKSVFKKMFLDNIIN